MTGQDTTDLTLSGLSGTGHPDLRRDQLGRCADGDGEGREDADAKNDKVTLTHAATGGEYEGVEADLPVTVDDDETVSIVLSKTT